ncbi:MAG: Ku protein [Rhodomicrobium sp.]
MPRAFWKGYLKLSLVSCAVALYPAVSKSERPRFHRISRQTGRRLRQQMVEAETEEPVEKEDVARGYEIPSRLPPGMYPSAEAVPRRERREEAVPGRQPREYVEIEEEELERIRTENTHTIDIEHFVPRAGIDDRYVDAAYYAAPTDEVGQEAYIVIRDAMRERKMAGLARIVLTRREHAVLVEPFGKGLLAVTLHYPYELRDEKPYFENIADLDLPREMKQLALHIVDTMKGTFDPSKIEDRYKRVLDELIASKTPARKAPSPTEARPEGRVINLMDVLRKSVEAQGQQGRKGRH